MATKKEQTETTEEITEYRSVRRRLQECRVKLQETSLKKSSYNSFSNYAYFELKDFLPTINRLMLEYDLITEFSIETLESTSGGTYSMCVLIIRDVDKSEDYVAFRSPTAQARVTGGNPVQELGAMQTYLRRYMLMIAFEIVENDVVDAQAQVEEKAQIKQSAFNTPGGELVGKTETRTGQGSASEKQISFIKRLIDEPEQERVMVKYHVDSLEALTSKEASAVITQYKKN